MRGQDHHMTNPTTSQPYADGLDLHDTPGIIVDRRPPELRARILGTGLEVWAVVKTYYEAEKNWHRFRASYEALTEDQLRAALAYAEKHWEVIQGRIAEEYVYVPASLRDTVPARWR